MSQTLTLTLMISLLRMLDHSPTLISRRILPKIRHQTLNPQFLHQPETLAPNFSVFLLQTHKNSNPKTLKPTISSISNLKMKKNKEKKKHSRRSRGRR
ncbi:hypothetical protein M6B38_149435 [Iris pallida]|uniref:Uncharacterized protein n=1 Tax=Iris pallida TaxID=29817 RepID=A0AAX6F783_IRIPA|nr:hypothetical protein M6B38_149435 [Iris pallida]